MSEFQQPQQTPMNPKEAKAQAKAAKAYSKASRPFYKKPWFIVLAVVVVIVIIVQAVSGGDSSSSDTQADSPSFPSASAADGSTAPEPSADAAPAGPTFAGQQDGDVSAEAGGTIDLDRVTLTATPLVDGESFGSPVTCSTITMQNGTDEVVNFGSYDWSLQDPNGAIRDFTINEADDSLDSGDLAAGGNVGGSVCFEAEASAPAGTYVLFYEPTFSFSSNRAAWVNVR